MIFIISMIAFSSLPHSQECQFDRSPGTAAKAKHGKDHTTPCEDTDQHAGHANDADIKWFGPTAGQAALWLPSGEKPALFTASV